MTSTNKTTIAEYLKGIPTDQRTEIKKVRELIKKNIGEGFKESINWGMISWEVPLSTYPDTYNKKPLHFIGLATQKNNISLYLMCIYQTPELLEELDKGFKRIGKKPNMGKSCIRFKHTDDIPMTEIGKIIKKITLKKFIAAYEAVKK